MVQILSAHTSETDNVEAAVTEILKQLDLEHRLLRHSAALMYYYADFAQTGVVKSLCEKLPFPVLAGTTSNSAVPGSREDITLTITVFTSDDCAFTAGISGPLKTDIYKPLKKLHDSILEDKPEGMGDVPAMFFMITPYLPDVTGDDYLGVLNGISDNVPIFGSIAFTHAADFQNIKTCFNGVEYDDALGLIAFWGTGKPKFFLSTIPEEQLLNHRAVITDSYRNRIKRINGVPVLEHLESIGLAKDGKLEGIASFPLVLHMPDGTRLVRTIYGTEDGELLCSGAVRANVSMEISFCDKDFVISSAQKTAAECAQWLEENQEEGRFGGVLVISCAARRWTLGTDVYAEIHEVDTRLNKLPYHFAYARGEFCPIPGKTESGSGGSRDSFMNCFYNYSMCICVL